MTQKCEMAFARVKEALEDAARQFRTYSQNHAAKGTPEADAKAQTNLRMAMEMEAALLSLPTIEGWRPLREVIKFGTKQRIWVWNKDIDEDGWYVAHVEADDTPALCEDYLDCPAIGIQTPEPPENGHD
jgi:hypothetical protein